MLVFISTLIIPFYLQKQNQPDHWLELFQCLYKSQSAPCLHKQNKQRLVPQQLTNLFPAAATPNAKYTN